MINTGQRDRRAPRGYGVLTWSSGIPKVIGAFVAEPDR